MFKSFFSYFNFYNYSINNYHFEKILQENQIAKKNIKIGINWYEQDKVANICFYEKDYIIDNRIFYKIDVENIFNFDSLVKKSHSILEDIFQAPCYCVDTLNVIMDNDCVITYCDFEF
jgi:hypothetical protein